jgi:hypothetical protein
MIRILDKPAGSTIEVRENPDGVTLQWPLPYDRRRQYDDAIGVGIWLCFWAVGEIIAPYALVTELLDGGPEWRHLFIGAWLGGWTIAGAVVIRIIWGALWPTRPESVKLGVDSFQHVPGWVPPVPKERLRWQPLFWWPKPLEVGRAELKGFFLDRVGGRQRLYFDHGADRVDIGDTLSESERVWLHTVLETWRRA